MKNNIALLLLAVLAASCSGRVKFDRIETTPLERYSIVYKDAKCGLYDNQADSLVTAVKYDALKYCGTDLEMEWSSQCGLVKWRTVRECLPLKARPTSPWR